MTPKVECPKEGEMEDPHLIQGGEHRDARGAVRFVNAFEFAGIDRFYAVLPARADEVRGWVGHRRDAKWFFVAQGVIEIGVIKPDKWNLPAHNLPVQTFRLEADAPQVLEVPPGHFTASIARTEGAILLIFSSGKIETAKEDDFRLAPDYWPMEAKDSSEPRPRHGPRSAPSSDTEGTER